MNPDFIKQHEELHIWQSRCVGPLFQFIYAGWAAGGWIIASSYWFFNTDENFGSLLETAVYFDNPLEIEAYKNDNNWPLNGANSSLLWGNQ